MSCSSVFCFCCGWRQEIAETERELELIRFVFEQTRVIIALESFRFGNEKTDGMRTKPILLKLIPEISKFRAWKINYTINSNENRQLSPEAHGSGGESRIESAIKGNQPFFMRMDAHFSILIAWIEHIKARDTFCLDCREESFLRGVLDAKVVVFGGRIWFTEPSIIYSR